MVELPAYFRFGDCDAGSFCGLAFVSSLLLLGEYDLSKLNKLTEKYNDIFDGRLAYFSIFYFFG